MSDKAKNGEVGYRRPPKANRWTKGQSGNLRKKRTKKKAMRLWQAVEAVLAKTVRIEGADKPVTLFELILKQLWVKIAAGDKRALRIWRKYEAFAKSMPDLKVLPPSKDGVNLFEESLKADRQ